MSPAVAGSLMLSSTHTTLRTESCSAAVWASTRFAAGTEIVLRRPVWFRTLSGARAVGL